MKNSLILVSGREDVVKTYEEKNIKVVITDKRLIIENMEKSYSILIAAISCVEIEKKGTKTYLKLYSPLGKNYFEDKRKQNKIEFLKREWAVEFESLLSAIMCC